MKARKPPAQAECGQTGAPPRDAVLEESYGLANVVPDFRPTTDRNLQDSFAADCLPRERMMALGRESLTNVELLAILLRTGTAGRNVIEVARNLLHHFGTLNNLVKATPDEIIQANIPGIGRVRAIELSATLELARRAMEGHDSRLDQAVTNPQVAADFLRPILCTCDTEHFVALPLDRKSRLIGRPITVTTGIVSASLVHPREVFRSCIARNASKIIVAHNHPSGDPTPSSEDIRVTNQLAGAGKLLDIPLLDHIVIGDPAVHTPYYASLRALGVIE